MSERLSDLPRSVFLPATLHTAAGELSKNNTPLDQLYPLPKILQGFSFYLRIKIEIHTLPIKLTHPHVQLTSCPSSSPLPAAHGSSTMLPGDGLCPPCALSSHKFTPLFFKAHDATVSDRARLYFSDVHPCWVVSSVGARTVNI